MASLIFHKSGITDHNWEGAKAERKKGSVTTLVMVAVIHLQVLFPDFVWRVCRKFRPVHKVAIHSRTRQVTTI